MKDLLLLTLLSVYLTACREEGSLTHNNYQKRTIALIGLDSNFEQKDTLSILDISIPDRLDTFYQWRNNSDCTDCGWIQYRFADSHYPIFAESGFFWLQTPDSTYSLTIRHKPKRWTEEGQTLRPIREKDSFLINNFSLQFSDTPFELLNMEYRNINGYYFYLFYLRQQVGILTQKPTIYLAGITNLRNREIQFIAEHSGRDSLGFYQKMYNSLLSIRIKEKL